MVIKHVYLFQEGNADMKDLLGSKGANLAEMTRIGLPVPIGFIITTETCMQYLDNHNKIPEGVFEQVEKSLEIIQNITGKKFGDKKNPLLLSVRSGAKLSMPGMMETILNLGLNDETVQGLIALTGDERFCYDSYRRLLQMYGIVVLDINKQFFDEIFDKIKEQNDAKLDTDLDAESLMSIVESFKILIKEKTGNSFPQDPLVQLKEAVEAVFRSWNIPRAISYRNHYKISHRLGTAVNIQSMVFGNMGNDSATGVSFTRNPSTGENEFYGEYLINAQGEDVVAGVRTPKPIIELSKEMPHLYHQYVDISRKLERHFLDIQDMEFTIEKGKLYVLQTRTGKRTARAALKIAIDMQKEKIISRRRAVELVDPEQLYQLLLPSFDFREKELAKKEGRLIAIGLNASPGAATGIIVFSPDEAEKRAKNGEKVILTRIETCPDDIHGMISAQGVLTTRGGMTSHAAVVARGMGKPCVAGCEQIKVDLTQETLVTPDGKIFGKGDLVSIDGASGEVYEGKVNTVEPKPDENFIKLLKWADEIKHLSVRANADTPIDALKALEFGAEGIGLCRTEHMFMAPDRLPVVRKMITAVSTLERQQALNELLPMQYGDFKEIFKIMKEHPVTIRLLDPPLHEFLPNHDELLKEVTELKCKNNNPELLMEKENLLKIVTGLKESNPMMGLRGCRLGIIYPEINEMQVKAIFYSACDLKNEGINVLPEIMIPLVGHVNELKLVREQLEKVAKQVMEEKNVKIEYKFGTMIEIPRAAMTAEEIAEYAEFFSFGTNDLTQMTFGFSRDDAEAKFLHNYVEKGVLTNNPFETLDKEGVGGLMKLAIKKGKSTKPKLKIGICGEHGGDPQSVKFCHQIGLNYVSCSPFRVPIARLAAAHASLEELGHRASVTH